MTYCSIRLLTSIAAIVLSSKRFGLAQRLFRFAQQQCRRFRWFSRGCAKHARRKWFYSLFAQRSLVAPSSAIEVKSGDWKQKRASVHGFDYSEECLIWTLPSLLLRVYEYVSCGVFSKIYIPPLCDLVHSTPCSDLFPYRTAVPRNRTVVC